MIENVLILDTETTGLHPDKGDRCIEIAAILYNIKYKTILQNFSSLFPCQVNPVEHINGIKAEATRELYPLDFVDAQLKVMASNAQVLIAHNAEFDKKFLKTLNVWQSLMHMPWICTKDNFEWPVSLFRKRLQDVCDGMGVSYINAHRALSDCRLIADCFSRVSDLDARMENALQSGQRTGGFASKGNAYA